MDAGCLRLPVVVGLTAIALAACATSRLEWTPREESPYEPRSGNAPVTMWVERTLLIFDLVEAADNPLVGTGPPDAVTLAIAKISHRRGSDWKAVVKDAKREARQLGGDVVVLRWLHPTVTDSGRKESVIVVMRSVR